MWQLAVSKKKIAYASTFSTGTLRRTRTRQLLVIARNIDIRKNDTDLQFGIEDGFNAISPVYSPILILAHKLIAKAESAVLIGICTSGVCAMIGSGVTGSMNRHIYNRQERFKRKAQILKPRLHLPRIAQDCCFYALSLSRRRQPRIKTPLSILSTSTVVEKIDRVKRKGQKLSSRQHRASIEARATAT